MKLLALVSGGKDSILAMMEAVKMGHEIGCIANVYPIAREEDTNNANNNNTPSADAEIDEIDSHCFQTVGHANIAQLAECLGLPLRRRGIREGQSVNTELTYTAAAPTDHSGITASSSASPTDAVAVVVVDEVEELFELIKSIIIEFPDIKGVCSGAILSTYQRLRVENICERLGLQSFSYLWSMEGGAVLNLIAEQHVNAILIKVATVGLNPRKHLGQSLMSESLRDLLLSLEADYQVHPAGEGGEFESFVLDCPLFPTHCLAIASRKIVIVDDNPISPTGRMEFSVVVVEKSEESLEARDTFFRQIGEGSQNEGTQDALDKQPKRRNDAIEAYATMASFHACGPFAAPKLLAKVMDSTPSDCCASIAAAPSHVVVVTEERLGAEAVVVANAAASSSVDAVVERIESQRAAAANAALFTSSPLIAAHADVLLSTGNDKTNPLPPIEQQLASLLTAAREASVATQRSVRMLLVYAPDLSAFGPLNAVYAATIMAAGAKWPLLPARAFVGTGIEGRIFLRVLFAQKAVANSSVSVQVDNLRIQSISHWGAATIGPYGQCVAETFADSSSGAKRVASIVVSGQIGLTPSTLALACPNALYKAAAAQNEVKKKMSGNDDKKEADAIAEEWRAFTAQFCTMLSNSLCPLLAMGPRNTVKGDGDGDDYSNARTDVWSVNPSSAWTMLTTTDERSDANTSPNSSTHATRLDIYLTKESHAAWAQWLWDAIVVSPKKKSGRETASVQPSFIVAKSLPRGGLVEMVTSVDFNAQSFFSKEDDSDDSDA